MNTLESRKSDERRRYTRNHLTLRVEGRTTTGNINNIPSEFHGHTTDVSPRGLCISADHIPKFQIGQQCKLMLQLFDGEPPVEAIGRLCWLKEGDQVREEQPIQIGFELLGMAKSIRGYDRWIERINWN
ncbi:MAG: PilZ domain-containing protein [Desulfocapsa sp.]|nr:PilZ domain-containing protein [Desulfocapsa sp.]